jgi:hypothetical protein
MLMLTVHSGRLRSSGEISFSVRTGVSSHVDSTQVVVAELRNLRAELAFQPSDKEGVALERWTVLPTWAVLMAFSLLLCHLLWRLCSNVERGEIFTTTNLKLVRGMGTALIGYTIVSSLAVTWINHRVARYASEHLSFGDLKLAPTLEATSGVGRFFDAARAYILHFDVSLLVTGLLVLALAEVFRQGLELRQETELTV